MVKRFELKPQLFRAVAKPDNVSTQEIAKARPVYIYGLPSDGDGGVTKPVEWDDVKAKPDTFQPGEHKHTIDEVDGLGDSLDGKAGKEHTHEGEDIGPGQYYKGMGFSSLVEVVQLLEKRIEGLELGL